MSGLRVIIDNNDEELELVSAYDDRKLYELNIFDAIEREKHMRRDKEDVVRFSTGVVKEVSDEIDSIRNKKKYSSEKIASSAIIHGVSLVQHIHGEKLSEMNVIQARLIDCESEFLCDMVSSSNESTYKIKNYPRRKSVVLPHGVLGAVSSINDVLFSDSGTLYQVCIAHSMYTHIGMVRRRKTKLLDIIKSFETHVDNNYDRFESANIVLDTKDFGVHEENVIMNEFLSVYKEGDDKL